MTDTCSYCGVIVYRSIFGKVANRAPLYGHEGRCKRATHTERAYFKRYGRWPTRRRASIANA